MRHRIKTQNLSRFSSYYKATLNSLAQAVVKNQRIITTKLKAKLAKKLVDRLVTWGKQADSLAARRRAFRVLCDHALVQRLFSDIAPMFRERNGGYTRIIPYKRRRGDNAEIVILELTMIKEKQKTLKHKTVPATAEKPKAEKPLETQAHVEPAPPEKEKHKHEAKKPLKKPLGGLGKIFKSERDSL
ncbi:50S ribosomal protein L17 [Candidatus Velamenicoccus archaeovorus]|uniref:50S ribosomal protein L17 n=1 Tax=Velamenicoccus archaeovorus TaxID=1930593 RepID=A0A410P493_VELA1|nr:50S ribosomal protein L17 [Candidatus Velamenicoccus archaeovorus]QAT16814.1 50S ribosomal protein L17 [Candidatus Velamenicoccus archaeovorus]